MRLVLIFTGIWLSGWAVTAGRIDAAALGCRLAVITDESSASLPSYRRFQITSNPAAAKYRIDYGDGTVEESVDGIFSHTYMVTGTFTVAGFASSTAVTNWQGYPSCRTSTLITMLEATPAAGDTAGTVPGLTLVPPFGSTASPVLRLTASPSPLVINTPRTQGFRLSWWLIGLFILAVIVAAIVLLQRRGSRT